MKIKKNENFENLIENSKIDEILKSFNLIHFWLKKFFN